MVDFDAYENDFKPNTTGSGASFGGDFKECIEHTCNNQFSPKDKSDKCPDCRSSEGF